MSTLRADLVQASTGTDTALKLKGKGNQKVKIGDAEISVPDVDGTVGQALVTDANGNLSFAAAGVASPVSTPDGGTGLTAAGAVGNLLTSNGTIWTSAVPAPGGAGYFQGNNGITGDSTNGLADIFRVNSGTLTVSTTIAASTNASCTGPFGVDPSVTLSVAGVLAII